MRAKIWLGPRGAGQLQVAGKWEWLMKQARTAAANSGHRVRLTLGWGHRVVVRWEPPTTDTRGLYRVSYTDGRMVKGRTAYPTFEQAMEHALRGSLQLGWPIDARREEGH